MDKIESVVERVTSTARAHPVATLVVTNALTASYFVYQKAQSQGGLVKYFSRGLVGALRKVPGASGAVGKELEKVKDQLKEDLIGTHFADEADYDKLPAKGLSKSEVITTMTRMSAVDEKLWKAGKASGSVYHGGGEGLSDLVGDAYKMYSLSNPLHPDMFPSVRKMEAEIIAMTLSLFNGPKSSVGSVTSGGTESILMAMKAYREWGRARGITEPEVVAPNTAHAAFDKGANYFGLRLIKVPVNPITFQVEPEVIRAAITRNTVMLVASAPQYPNGVVDPIQEIGAIATEKDIPMHVDCCLGSFMIAMASACGVEIAPFDFRVPGVTSISCDTHKYGFAPKGSSVLMYRNRELRAGQYFTCTRWPGGVYASPTIAGSRAGAMVAVTWAVMVHIGYDGYKSAVSKILDAAQHVAAAIRNDIPELELKGDPKLGIVAFGDTKGSPVSFYHVVDELKKLGWALNVLQEPPAVHLCVTYANHANAKSSFVGDLKNAIATVKKNGAAAYKKGSAAVYGTTASVDDDTVDEIAHSFLDCLTALK